MGCDTHATRGAVDEHDRNDAGTDRGVTGSDQSSSAPTSSGTPGTRPIQRPSQRLGCMGVGHEGQATS
ncbi:hypothetical protein HIM_10722 [Hirsutella minnesotensis 3608]|uniref:Uncharacterized protein n=1 Tax=Hirsutella minnesotensis 3608 TaxID=1043627 RepID=A0A0F8A1Z6_9HYPO|nr:hypothetical protein HIM_10722 [Hirsutella minnesotensis 3608]